MSATTVEWIAVALFFVCFFGFSILESFWLNKKNLIPFDRAFAFSFATNTLSISVGFFVSFVIFAVLFMLAWDGSLQQVPVGNVTIWAAVIVAALFPLALLILAKRLMLRMLKKASVDSPWWYSSASAIVFLLLVSVTPFLFIYFV